MALPNWLAHTLVQSEQRRVGVFRGVNSKNTVPKLRPYVSARGVARAPAALNSSSRSEKCDRSHSLSELCIADVKPVFSTVRYRYEHLSKPQMNAVVFGHRFNFRMKAMVS